MYAARNYQHRRRAFTLVEVMIVVIILGILAALVVPQFTNAADDAREGNIASQIRTIELQLELYRARTGQFPPVALMVAAPVDPQFGTSFGVLIDAGYLRSAPANPYTNGDIVGTDWTYDVVNGTIRAVRP